mgnify:CR=1 FL=1
MKRVAVARARIAHETNTKNGPMDQTLLVNTFVIDFFGYRAAPRTPRTRKTRAVDVESELTDATRPSAMLTRCARARDADAFTTPNSGNGSNIACKHLCH